MSQKSSQKSPKTPQKDIERFQKAFTATTLRSCSPASLGAKLVELGDIVQAVTPHMDPKQAADILKKSGFATELMRDAFLNSTVANQLVAGCLVVDLLELTVPEMIFDGHEKKLFRFMLRQFEQLERSSRTSESYKKAVYIAEKVASTRFLIVLSEADDTEEQTRELFDLCLNRLSARGMEDSALGRHLQEMMVSVLDDVQTVDDEAMALFIQPLSMEGKKRNPGGAMVVKGVMRKLSEKLVQVVSRHIMQRAEELEGDLDDASKDHKRTLSEMRNLLTVVMELGDPTEGHTGLLGYLVPHFVQKLTHQNTPLRNIVMKCFGTLFAENTSLVQTYKVAFRKFLQCFDDQGKELRAWMVGEWAGRFVRSKMPEEDVKKLVLRIVRKHCTDAEEAVRKVCVDATAIICSAVLVPEQAPQGGAALHGEARELLSTAVLHLMRDKKSAVRAHARERFMVLYNEEVQKSYNAIQAYALIPAQLIACDGLNGQQTDGCIAELLPEPGLDGDAGAQASSALTVQLVKLWVALTSTGRAQTEKWLRGKRAARELTARLCELRLKAKGAESDEASPGKQGAVQQAAREQAHLVLERLAKQCHVPPGRDPRSLFHVKDEKWWRSLNAMARDPAKICKREQRERFLGQVRAYAKGGSAERTAQLRDAPEVAAHIVDKVRFPVDEATAAELLTLTRQRWGIQDGANAEAMTELISALAFPFRDLLCSEGCRGLLVALLTEVAETEAAGDCEAPDGSQSPPPRGSGGKRKFMSVGQRRAVLRHLLRAALLMHRHLQLSAEGLAEPGLVKALRNVCTAAPQQEVKLALELLHAIVAETPQAKLLSGIAAESVGALSAAGSSEQCKRLAALRALQRLWLLHPAAVEPHRDKVLQWVRGLLSAAAKKQFPSDESHSFRSPPAPLLRFRMALKCLTAAMLAVPDKLGKNEGALRGHFRELCIVLRHVSLQESPLSGSLMTCDTVKAMVRLARDPECRKLCFGPTGEKRVWDLMAYTTQLTELPECREEVARKLTKALLQDELPQQFMQLLVPLLHVRSKQTFNHIKDWIARVIAHQRDRCVREGVMLDSREAPRYWPEYVIPNLLHLLARWPGLSDRSPSFEPIQKCLFVFLDALTNNSDCASFVFDFLRKIKQYDDAHAPETNGTRLMCDLAFQVLRSVTDTKEVKVRPFPGGLFLPVCYARQPSSDYSKTEATYLDESTFVPLKRDALLSRAALAGAPEEPGSAKRSPTKRLREASPSPVKRAPEPAAEPKPGGKGDAKRRRK
eukprot:TRINITY_DN474_c0_g1_i4.p1 TRINITY_DN474_c0_g1~~TRINITY_DN474_c0_g1_i4.p1  ORF type:complete len:1268 (+),score=475.99 TRINITY_DN474_c0_g1_i4:86-3889(+)